MKPTYTLHKLPQGYVLTSDEEIKEGDTVIGISFPDLPIAKVISKYGDEFTAVDGIGNKHGLALYDSEKVITQDFDFSALSPEEQKEIGWFDVEQEAEHHWTYKEYGFEVGYNPIRCVNGAIEKPKFINGYKAGFQKAQELLSDRKFTLEDMIKAWDNGFEEGNSSSQFREVYSDKYIQSLSQPKSWEVLGIWENNKFKITQIIEDIIVLL